MASRNGKAIAVPTPLRSVRRETAFFDMNIALIS
jgi:hypothetical protein